jgi:hypothetical protein
MSDEKFSNGLSDAQLERLALLSKEMGEAQQAIGKILRHGYESYNPLVDTGMTNRRELEREIGDVWVASEMVMDAHDVSRAGVIDRANAKKESLKKWLHHQNREPR